MGYNFPPLQLSTVAVVPLNTVCLTVLQQGSWIIFSLTAAKKIWKLWCVLSSFWRLILNCNIFFIFSFFKILTVIQVQFFAFSLHLCPQPQPSHLPALIPSHLGFVHVSFIVVPENTSSFSPSFSPPLSPLVTVHLFLISLSLVIFYLLFCFIDVTFWIPRGIWKLIFNLKFPKFIWLLNLFIMESIYLTTIFSVVRKMA